MAVLGCTRMGRYAVWRQRECRDAKARRWGRCRSERDHSAVNRGLAFAAETLYSARKWTYSLVFYHYSVVRNNKFHHISHPSEKESLARAAEAYIQSANAFWQRSIAYIVLTFNFFFRFAFIEEYFYFSPYIPALRKRSLCGSWPVLAVTRYKLQRYCKWVTIFGNEITYALRLKKSTGNVLALVISSNR